MAFNKKNKRRITVDNQLFYYSVTGTDHLIRLLVMTEVEGSGKLTCAFDYHQIQVPLPSLPGVFELRNQFVVTPYIVRQAIEYGLKQGWQPQEKSPDVPLGFLDDKIELRLDKNRADCFTKAV